jgi:gliding motility-associated-like protein
LNRPFLNIILFFLLLLAKITCFAQLNLVPNGSFEEYDTCPTFYSTPGDPQIEHCKHWYAPTQGTSDYFNTCALISSNVNIPYNWGGFQYPYDGNAYVGILAYYIDFYNPNNYSEYIQTKLNECLIQNQEYFIEFYVCRGGRQGIAIDRIGALFTSYPISRTDAKMMFATPQIENPRHQIIKDTVNWTKISGTFIAEGGECYLTIGNFYSHEDTDTILYNPDWPDDYSSYFIDGVSLKPVDSRITIPNVFTPNGDEFNDAFILESKSITHFEGKIYNRWGRKLYEWNDITQGWNGIYNGSGCSDGVYYIEISAKGAEGKEYYLKSSFQLLK